MKVGIIQPNYIPWRGYFDFIDEVDLFIFYDDVQYTRRDWRNRNRIKTPQGLKWLTVPVHFHQSTGQLICHSRIDHSRPWQQRHINLLQANYRQAPFYQRYADEFFALLNQPVETIAALNVRLARWIMAQLAIVTPTRLASELNAAGAKTDRLLDLLRRVGATTYLTGPAAKAYLEPEKFAAAGIALEYKAYVYPPYPQLWGQFEPAVTILDLMFNCGERSRDYLKSLQPNERARAVKERVG